MLYARISQICKSTAVPCSFNFNGLKHPGAALSKERLQYNGCFEAPAGEWTTLVLRVARVSAREWRLRMAMGDVSYDYTHELASAEEEAKSPSKIDTLLIQYPNGRHFSYVQLAPIANSSSAEEGL